MPPFAIAPIPSVQVPMSVTSATRARRAPKKQASAPVPRTWIRISSVRRLAVPFAHDRPKDVLVERVRARVLESVRVLDEAPRRGGRLTLSFEAAELVHLLRRQADVADDRDSRSDEGLNRRHDLAAPFQLHGVHAALLQESARVSHRVADGGLV